MRKILIPLFALFLSAASWAGATFSRVKTWTAGETLTASDLNAEYTNILTNLTPAGIDDYSASNTEMRTVTDPYPASSESLATSLAGELERVRYQILEIKKAMQASNVTYWYQDLPTAGVWTIAGSSVGVNDTTPDYQFDFDGSTIAVDGNITTSSDDVDFSTHVSISGNLSVSGNLTFSGFTHVIAYATYTEVGTGDRVIDNMKTEDVDTLSEWNGSTFTAINSGIYHIETCLELSYSGGSADTTSLWIRRNGSVIQATGHGTRTSWHRSAGASPDPCLTATYSLSASDTLTVYLDIGVEDPVALAGSRVSVFRVP